MTQAVWYELHITDKTGRIGFKTNCTDWGLNSERKNLQAHIDNAKKFPEYYRGWDIDSMVLVSPKVNEFDFSYDDIKLLEALGV